MRNNPSRISSRIYEEEKDFQIIINLMTAIRPPKHLNDYPVKIDIEENLAFAVVRANTRLWFDNRQPIAWAYVDEFNNLWWEFDKRYEELIDAQIVEWGESCVRKTIRENELTTLDTSCREDYAERITFLKRYGFRQTENITIMMVRDLFESIRGAKLPPGFMIRPIAGSNEAEAVAKMHRAAFGTDYMTTENRLAIMNTSEYDPSLDLIVIAPDGAIVANCICLVNPQEKSGSTDPVAAHPRYQNMGLARALLTTGMELLKAHGMLSARLGTSDDNIAMQRAAEAVGFKVEYRKIWFAKKAY
ncbi:MAG TPA: GNAT family N-acetyltransferase [Anaerolineales bacterium]|nr:GNAT family N-acetyltransferase [Anaerolineales bacterium]